MNVIGRYAEKDELDRVVNSKKSEFVVVYGRRRVGKTFLIKQHFKGRFTFYTTGLADSALDSQLTVFNATLKTSPYYKETTEATSWMEAFQHLTTILGADTAKIKLIFIDELPWMDTRGSKLLMALDYFWNSWASARSDIKLLVCGSSASWMIKKLMNNTGGLYNRVTNRMQLKPFTLGETEEYLKQLKAKYSRYQIVELYMALGGIPYYLSFVRPEWSVAQNINALFFTENAKFKNEFNLIFESLFSNHERHIAIVKALTKKKKGLLKAEIVKDTKIPDGGSLTNILRELEASDFIRKYTMPGKRVRNAIYQLTDNFILFYSNFLLKKISNDQNYWINTMGKPAYNAWAGLAFEMVCLQHTNEIKKGLGIDGVYTDTYAWTNGKAQVDLIFDRSDDVINLMEIKFSSTEYTVTDKYLKNLRNKVSEFQNSYHTKKAIWVVMMTTFGLSNKGYGSEIHTSMTMDILFQKY